ncbi:transposase family protein [Nonomuraea sp. NPDC049158]|uniref:transposase family protein n=1 Tax=Nonomuraea sp. NPDC049158 TaxID=3155649 RepID=UPI0033EE0B23
MSCPAALSRSTRSSRLVWRSGPKRSRLVSPCGHDVAGWLRGTPGRELPTVAEVLDTLPDPRCRRGRRYRLGPLLTLPLLAVLSGATSSAKIGRFIAGYDPDLRAPSRPAWLPPPGRSARSRFLSSRRGSQGPPRSAD